MNIGENVINKILSSRIWQYIKKEIYSILGIQGYINIQKTFNINRHINREKKKNHTMFRMQAKCEKIQHPLD